MTRVLVTGGEGFVGARLCAHLAARGHDVLVLDRVEPAAGDAVLADVRDRAAVRDALREHGAQAVVHLAAIHFIPQCEADPAECLSVNIGGTDAVLGACADAEVGAVVFASTGAVYRPSDQRHREESALGPTDTYGRTKLAGERLVERFHQRTGVPVAVARLFNVFGPGETNPHLVPAILEQALAGSELMLGNLDSRREYVYVDDVAGALAVLLDAAPRERALTCNIGSERDVDGFTLVEAVGRLLGRHLEVRTDPARLRPSDRPRLASECARARSVLGWSARTSLEDGLREALRQPTAPRA